ncbi:hypothetical protein CBR_g29454 [Chara braunii]|uniref:ALOG domain-containing protein n=1 Tax=Chara braunii TaxID=69332 RepID=A0A388LAF7_CHABU|nr:hypothetical protein CBR_g29454 [Chara braunii]|eukprot:GBG79305.1 hypothetical protein CBR_g29454 [Chara braunii]
MSLALLDRSPSSGGLGGLGGGLGALGGGGGGGGGGGLDFAAGQLPSPSSSLDLVSSSSPTQPPSRYNAQKRRDWTTFGQYLKNHRPPVLIGRCTFQHVVDFLRYLDQFGKTKVHLESCQFYGCNNQNNCGCPMRQAWGSLDSLVGRLRAAYEENGGRSETNPFGARQVRSYLRDVRDEQAKARGIGGKKRKRPANANNNTALSQAQGGSGASGNA